MNEDLLERIRNGDDSALAEVYIQVEPSFMRFLRNNFPKVPAEEVKDIYVESIIAFWQNVRNGTFSKVEVSIHAYIIAIGRNMLIRHLEKQERSRSLVVEYSSLQNHTHEEIYDPAIDETVRKVMADMKDVCKRLLHLCYFEKKSMAEIALIMGYSNADTVKAKKYRCIKQYLDGKKNRPPSHE